MEPGKEWLVPPQLVPIVDGRAQVWVTNLTEGTIHLGTDQSLADYEAWEDSQEMLVIDV